MQAVHVCAVCRDLIGVHERLVTIAPGSARATSLVREAALDEDRVMLVHRRCAAPAVAAAVERVGPVPSAV